VEKISIVIPVFNEQDSIENTIQEIDELLEISDLDFNIIVINDGSTDRTSEILEGITNPSFRVIHHENNRGYGCLESGDNQ